MIAHANMWDVALCLRARTSRYAEWQKKLSEEAMGNEMSRVTISEEKQRRQILAGQLLVAQQVRPRKS